MLRPVPRRRHILLWVAETHSHGRDIIRGVLHFARHRADWQVQRQPPGRRTPPPALVARAHGIIAFINSSRGIRAFARARGPVVNVAASLPDSPWPIIANDDFAIGQMAAEHFLEKGYHSFAYVGHRGSFAPHLEEGFAERLAQEGLTHESFAFGRGPLSVDPRLFPPARQLVRWVARLPSATAVFAIGNVVGAAVIDACRRAKRAVPEEIAVLGLNNDDLTCESIEPPLSSIQTAGEQIGRRAAMLLADMLSGLAPPQAAAWVPPLGVVARASTGALAVNDPVLSAAMEFIRSHVHEPLTVEDVLDELLISRKSLERKFRLHLRRTPLAEIRRVHVHEAQRLLIHTDYPIGEVARRSGFARAQHMATVFRKAVGTTPSAYRQQFRNR